jgi:hypothetical protein
MAQHDYNLANQSGLAFRQDLNNALAAIVSQNSGASEPSTTYAYQRWADITAGVMKMRNGANNAWITLYQLDGEYTAIAIENGTAAAPAFYFKDSGTDTGIYSSGADALDFSTGGTRRLGIGSAGDVTVYTGNVTINAQGDLRFADSDSSNWVAFQAPATVASNVTWTLPSTDGTSGQVLSTNGSGTLSWATDGGGSKIEVGNTKAEVTDTGSNGKFAVTVEGTESLTVTSDGTTTLTPKNIIKSGTAVASTSGTSIDFTGLPSWVKRVTVMFDGVSTNGTSSILIQLGTSSGIESTGFNGGHVATDLTVLSTGNSTAGALIVTQTAADAKHGQIVFSALGSNVWVFGGQLRLSNTQTSSSMGSKTLSGTLDRVRITTVNGTDTFDAGTINILYEG